MRSNISCVKSPFGLSLFFIHTRGYDPGQALGSTDRADIEAFSRDISEKESALSLVSIEMARVLLITLLGQYVMLVILIISRNNFLF